jgi:hypothetical protein
MWYPHEKRTILTAEPLANGAVRLFNNIFPLDGTGWTVLRLILCGVIGAAVTPYADGLYRWIKGITLKTSRGEVIYNNVPGMALYPFNAFLNHSFPWHNPLLAAGGTFRAVIDLPFVMPFLGRGEDTIFDSGRYSNLELQIATGTLADFAPAGAASAAVTLTLETHYTIATMKQEKNGTFQGKPNAALYVSTYPLIHADVQRFWDLESSLDLGLFGYFIFNHDASNVPFCKTAAGSDALTDVIFEDTVRRWINTVSVPSFQEKRQTLVPYNLYAAVAGTEIPTTLVGYYPYLFIKNGSVNEVYPTGKKSRIRLDFTNATPTDEADLCVFGMRALR